MRGQLVCHGIHQVVCVHRCYVLGAIPTRIAVTLHHVSYCGEPWGSQLLIDWMKSRGRATRPHSMSLMVRNSLKPVNSVSLQHLASPLRSADSACYSLAIMA